MFKSHNSNTKTIICYREKKTNLNYIIYMIQDVILYQQKKFDNNNKAICKLFILDYFS